MTIEKYLDEKSLNSRQTCEVTQFYRIRPLTFHSEFYFQKSLISEHLFYVTVPLVKHFVKANFLISKNILGTE